MKNFNLMRMVIAILLAGFCFQAAQSQIQPAFQYLDLSAVNSGFLYAQASVPIDPPDATSFNSLDVGKTRQLFFNFKKSCLNTTATFPEFSTLRSTLRTVGETGGCIPLAIMEMRYHNFVPDPIGTGVLSIVDDHYVKTSGNTQNPFVEKKTLSLLADVESYHDASLKFKLDPSCYFQNYGSMPSLIRIDFGDGTGWRTITPGQVIQVTYNSVDQDRELKLEVTRSGQIKRSGFILKHNVCASSFPSPSLPPWPVADAGRPWQITTQAGGQTVKANAYTLVSADGVFDKPFVFVEGVDFGSDHGTYINGTFGWCQFTSGISDAAYDYAMLENMPQLLSSVRAQGYDIVLLDFYDGATWLQNNGQLLVNLINLCNQYKTGSEPLVVAGASMGGQITRYALSYMEHNNMNHCTRLWISLDSPHTGANIPLALQASIVFLSAFESGADVFKNEFLLRPAAQQMLMYQWLTIQGPITNPTRKNEWYSLLNSLGFPKQCRTIGIANGNVSGHGLSYPAFEALLDEGCNASSLLPGDEFHFYLVPLPGDIWHDSSTETATVIAELTYTSTYNLGGTFQVPSSLIPPHVELTVPAGLPAWDYAPGGTRNSVKTFVNSFNINPQYVLACGPINQDQYNTYHNFIPTSSALGIMTDQPFLNVMDYLQYHPDACPFDRWMGPVNGNERHSEVSSYNLPLILKEILAGENPGGTPLLSSTLNAVIPSKSTFNYGKQEFSFMRSLTVNAGGKLWVNRAAPLHYGLNEPLPAEGSVFRLSTLQSCSDVNVIVGNNGFFEIGDPADYARAEMTLERSATMEVQSGGTLRIYNGSKLIIANGAVLKIKAGSTVVAESGSIEVLTGGRLIYEGGNVFLNGGSSKILLKGGRLEVADGATFSIPHQGVTGGFIEVVSDDGVDIVLGINSNIRLEGDGMDDLILRVNNWSILRDQSTNGSSFKLINGRVDLTNNGDIWLGSDFVAFGVSFVDYSPPTMDAGDVVVWWNGMNVNGCSFQQVALTGYHSKVLMYNSQMNGKWSGLSLSWGGYLSDNNTFSSCGISSNLLDYISNITRTAFIANGGFGNGGIAVSDESLVELVIKNSSFNAGNKGVSKSGGKLSLRCNTFSGNDKAIYAAKGTVVNMSGSDAAGYNYFTGNGTNLFLDKAAAPLLQQGYNVFAGFTSKNIQGTVSTLSCASNCGSLNIPGTANVWSYGSTATAPNPAHISVYTTATCTGGAQCPVLIPDTSPRIFTDCSALPTIALPGKNLVVQQSSDQPMREETGNLPGILKDGPSYDPSNPVVDLPGYGSLPLDSALVIAAMRMQMYDSTGNDIVAVEMFYDILTSGLDKSEPNVRWLMGWGVNKMKSAIEALFVSNALAASNNYHAFETPVDQYVEVLNLLTDSVLTDSTYRQQFYIELNKGQLFRTLQRPQIARQIFSNLDNCRLDSLEQTVLNYWLIKIDEELAFMQLDQDDLTAEAVDVVGDSSEYNQPENYSSSDFYFGAWIHSPQNIQYVSCGNAPSYRIEKTNQTNHFAVYPNPSDGFFTIESIIPKSVCQLSVLDMTGREVRRQFLNFAEARRVLLDFSGDISPGKYYLRITDDQQHSIIPIIIQ